MPIEATAPGKLVVLGEYAVLEGVPALVLAVDRRVRVSLAPAGGDTWVIAAPTLSKQARLRVRAGGVAWGTATPVELAWVGTLLEHVPFRRRLPACRVELASDALYLLRPGTRTKLGLGSSAALVVALLGALHALAGLPPPTLGEAIGAHRAIQGGRGSGIDAAASLTGGLVRFQRDAGGARAARVSLPGGLQWCCTYSGTPASTPSMLGQVAAWRAREPDGFARQMRELATISARGIDAVAANDADAFCRTLRDYMQALARFGESAGVDIASAPHRELGAIAAASGCVYKSCGAGGGDVGVTFAAEDGALQAFRTRAARAGYHVIDLHAARHGLLVASSD